VKASFAYCWWDYTFAVNLSGLEYSFGGNYSSQRAATAGLGISYYHQKFFVGLSADNLNSPKVTDGSPAINPQVSLFGEIIGKETFSLTARATFEKDQSVQLALGQKIDVSNKSAIFWGFDTEPFQLGGGFDFWYNTQGAITYAFGYHPTLGISHNLSLIYHFGKQKKPVDTFE
ncbi:MAG TPA: type IX secretion system membrane protein PorP/SprF, partial [candidate division Zixibacteria bacterium]|nr:type IX secretion system membrane protein PorP/SprF [candidate division Zixibacteria bacterium]